MGSTVGFSEAETESQACLDSRGGEGPPLNGRSVKEILAIKKKKITTLNKSQIVRIRESVYNLKRILLFDTFLFSLSVAEPVLRSGEHGPPPSISGRPVWREESRAGALGSSLPYLPTGDRFS